MPALTGVRQPDLLLLNDGDFTFESLFGRFNAELANDLGNLVNRSLTLISGVWLLAVFLVMAFGIRHEVDDLLDGWLRLMEFDLDAQRPRLRLRTARSPPRSPRSPRRWPTSRRF